MEKKLILRSILWQKFLIRIETKSFAQIINILCKTLIFISILSWLIYPEKISNLVIFLSEWKENIIIKGFFIGFFIFQFEKFISIIPYLIKIFKKQPVFKKQIGTINGIPTMGLIDHLLIVKSFKRADIESKFEIPRRKYESLAKVLDKMGIIQKDKNKNNAFIFNSEFTEQDLINIFRGKNDAQSLENFTQRIENEILLSPTPNFTQKRIT